MVVAFFGIQKINYDKNMNYTSLKYMFWRIFLQKRFMSFPQSNEISSKKDDQSITAIIFSKDRAIQLHALLNSFIKTKVGKCNVIVVYTTSQNHDSAYLEIKKIYGEEIIFLNEKDFLSFKMTLKKAMELTQPGKVFFLVDDIVFTEEVDYGFILSLNLTETIFSLRMGINLKHSYVKNSSQPIPSSLHEKNDMLLWYWSTSHLEWNYPLSVDGHIFSTKDVNLWIDNLNFYSPNSFEHSLQKLKSIYIKKMGMSFKKSRIVNVPVNKVQNEVSNNFGGLHQDELLNKWHAGFAIDTDKLMGFENISAHQEINFEFIKR